MHYFHSDHEFPSLYFSRKCHCQGASIITKLIGIVNVKVFVALLGPAGVGLMGLYQNIMGVASTMVFCVFVAVAAWKLVGYKSSNRIIWYVSALLLLCFCVLQSAAHLVLTLFLSIGIVATVAVSIYSLVRPDGLLDLRGLIQQKFGK